MNILNESYSVRCEVARNPNTPKEVLVLLATDENSYVRWRVAQNPNTPEETILLIKSIEFQKNKPLLKLAH